MQLRSLRFPFYFEWVASGNATKYEILLSKIRTTNFPLPSVSWDFFFCSFYFFLKKNREKEEKMGRNYRRPSSFRSDIFLFHVIFIFSSMLAMKNSCVADEFVAFSVRTNDSGRAAPGADEGSAAGLAHGRYHPDCQVHSPTLPPRQDRQGSRPSTTESRFWFASASQRLRTL